jgi:hypothetical protein
MKNRLRVFENRVLRIFGMKRDEGTGGWRKLHNEKLRNLYSSPSIIRRPKLVGHVAIKAKKGMHTLLVEKLEGRKPLGRTRHR